MKFLSAVNRYLLLAAGVLAGSVSCTDDPEPPQSDLKVSIEIASTNFSSVSFTLKAEGGTPTLYAYKAVEKGTTLTAQQVYDEGIRATAQAEPYTLSELTNDTEYTLYAVAMSQSGLSPIASAEFTTIDDPGAPATPQSIGIRINKVTETGINYSLQRGSMANGGLMAIWGTVVLNNYIDDEIMLSGEDLSREDVVAGLLQAGFGMQIDGTEQNAEWTAEKLLPDADYTVMLMGLVNGKPADVTLVEFRTEAFDLIGSPKVTLSVEKKDYMMVWIRYMLNKDAYGYMRFITDKSEIDRYMENHTEDDLREFVRFSEPLFEQLYQRYIDLEHVDEQGNAYKISSTNLGWEAAGREYTAMAVACDKNKSVPKEMARIDFRLDEFPEGTDPAKFTCEARNIAADNFDLHFELEESCRIAYCNVIPAGDELKIEDQLAYSRKLWDEGWAMHRVNEQEPTSPLANQDDMYVDVHPGGTYVIVATGVNYDGVLNETLTVSEPFTMKEYTYENSEAAVTPSVDRIGKTSVRAIYRTGEKTRMVYDVTLLASDPLLKESEDAIRTYLMEHGNILPYFHEKTDGWVPELGAITYTWPEMTPGTDYVILSCGQDTEGRISSVARCAFTTLAATPGPDPQVTLSAHDLTPVSCKFDIEINQDVREMIYALMEDEVLNYVPGKDSEDVLEGEIFAITLSNGIVAYDSVTDVEASGLSYGGTFYLGVIAYGSGTTETFKYIKVQLPDPTVTAMTTLSSVLLGQVDPLPGNGKKALEALREKNMQAVDRSPIDANGVAYVRDAEDAQNVLEQMGGYRPMRSKAALQGMKKF